VRLTLRTLLAYLDDILEPAQAKEIGEKLAESGVASTLVNRIREVMRRRRLTSPDLEGPASGLDPSTVAEYLDNTLPPDSVADVEKVCLESDIHLAEVAACHQILTLVLGEPVEIIPKSRERMYALGPIAKQETVPPDADLAAKQKTVVRQASASPDLTAEAKGSAASFSERIPDYLRPRPLWRRALPYIAVCLFFGIWVGLISIDPTFFPRLIGDDPQPAANRNNALQVAATNVGNGLPEDAWSVPDQQLGNVSQQIEPVEPRTIDMNRPQPNELSLDPAPPDDEPETENRVQDGGPKLAVNGQPLDQPHIDDALEPAAQPKDLEPGVAAVVHYNSPDGILLRYDTNEQDWFGMWQRAVIHPGDQIASPEPFVALLNVDNGHCLITLKGGTSARWLPMTKAAPFGLEIKRGRVTVRSKRTGDFDEAGQGNVSLAVAVKDELWRLELMSAQTLCGIEITPRQPDAFEQEFGKDTYRGKLYVVSGSVRFFDGSGSVQVVNERNWLSLTPSDRDLAAQNKNSDAAMPLATIPPWLDENAKRPLRSYADRFEEAFEKDQVMSLSVPAAVKDPRPQISELAVKALALTENYKELVRALAQAEHEEAREAAVIGLRTWLPAAPDNSDLLKVELEQAFSDDAIVISRLLWGFNENDAHSKSTSEQLVTWLEHPHVAVRELAFYHIYRLTGQKYNYRPLSPASQRKTAARHWRNHVNHEGALLR
jgi:hypothetical protein